EGPQVDLHEIVELGGTKNRPGDVALAHHRFRCQLGSVVRKVNALYTHDRHVDQVFDVFSARDLEETAGAIDVGGSTTERLADPSSGMNDRVTPCHCHLKTRPRLQVTPHRVDVSVLFATEDPDVMS